MVCLVLLHPQGTDEEEGKDRERHGEGRYHQDILEFGGLEAAEHGRGVVQGLTLRG